MQFVKKTAWCGKEQPWDIEKEIEVDLFYDSPSAKQVRVQFQKQAPLIMFWFFIVLIILFLILKLIWG
jgi:hypothetical protein